MAISFASTHAADDLAALHRAIIATPGFDRLVAFDQVEPEADPAGAIASVRTAMPGVFFAPHAHLRLARAYELIGDEPRAQVEAQIAQLALFAIHSSGDGTRDRPWQVLRVDDEYAYLGAHGLASVEQRLLTVAGRKLDQHTLTDGSSVWFQLVGG